MLLGFKYYIYYLENTLEIKDQQDCNMIKANICIYFNN